MTRIPFPVLLGVLIGLRILATGFGFDRRPVVTSNDEIFWAEPAWSVLHGRGYLMPCFPGTMFTDLYATHPPVYVALVAVGFGSFGMTPWTLRGWSLAAHLAGVVVLLFVFRRLRRLRVFDDTGYAVAALLLVTNFSTLSLARWGRPDPVCVLFAAVGFLVLVGGRFHCRRAVLGRALGGGVLIGLAVLSHTLSVVFYAAFVYALFLLRRRLGWGGVLAAAALPGVIAGFVWLAMYQDRVFEALAQHRMLARQMGGASADRHIVFDFLDQLAVGNWRGFLQAGGTTSLLLVATPLAFVGRAVLDVRTRSLVRRPLPGWVVVLPLLAVVGLLVFRLTGLSISRTYYYFPIALVCLGVVVSHLTRAVGRVLLGLVVVAAVVELVQTGYYLADTARTYEARRPDRFDSLIRSLPRDGRIAVPPVLWFQARAAGLDIQLVDTGIPFLWEYWTETPDPFRECVVVILPAGSAFESDPRLRAAPKEVVPEIVADLIVYRLRPSVR
jgi:hypothetical protein